MQEQEAIAVLQKLHIDPFFQSIQLNNLHLRVFYQGVSPESTEFINRVQRLLRSIFSQEAEDQIIKNPTSLAKAIENNAQSPFFQRSSTSISDVFPVTTYFDEKWIVIPATKDPIDAIGTISQKELYQLAIIRMFTTFGILADRGTVDNITLEEFYYSFIKYMLLYTEPMHMKLLEITLKCILSFILPQLNDGHMAQTNNEFAALSSLYNQLAVLIMVSLSARTLTYPEAKEYNRAIFKDKTIDDLFKLRTQLLHNIHVKSQRKALVLQSLLHSQYAQHLPFFNQFYFKLGYESIIPAVPKMQEYLLFLSPNMPPRLIQTQKLPTHAFRFYTNTYGDLLMLTDLTQIYKRFQAITVQEHMFCHILPEQKRYKLYKIKRSTSILLSTTNIKIDSLLRKMEF